MQLGGFNNRDREDKFISYSKSGGNKTIEKLTTESVKAGRELKGALGVNRTLYSKMGKTIGGLTRGATKALAPLKAIIGSVLKTLPKQILAIGGLFTMSFVSFSSCSYHLSNEDSGETGNYISDDNSIGADKDGNSIIVYSNANANVKTYYEILSRRKSVWQEYTDENGETILIYPTDENAVSDYFRNDLNFYIEPDLLFCMNKSVFGDKSVMPELFLNPVNYNKETYELEPLTDEYGLVIAESDVYNSDGSLADYTKKNVSSYGIASVLTYRPEVETTRFTGTYIKQDSIDNDGVVSQNDINEPFTIVKSSTEYHVLEHAVTFSGDITYEYEPSTTRTSGIQMGESSTNETDTVEIYCYYSGDVQFRRFFRTIVNENGTSISPKDLQSLNPSFNNTTTPYSKSFMLWVDSLEKGYTEEEIQAWISGHTIEYPYTDDTGEHIATVSYVAQSNLTTRTVTLNKYRSGDSGCYVDFVNQKETTANELGNGYLYDYMENFSCYRPTNISRDYETFLKMTSQASNSNSLIGGSSNMAITTGTGSTLFEQIYNGSDEGKELLETIWDILITWGYSEEQTASIMGNMAQESGYNVNAVNSVSGAFGICQWLGKRKTDLDNFAGGSGNPINNLELQINYVCMEISPDYNYAYAENQWLPAHANYKQAFKNSDDVESLTEAVCFGFERCGVGEANLQNRISNALSAYEILKGRTPTHICMAISPVGESTTGGSLVVTDTSSVTKNMNEADKKEFNRFYHALDDIYSGDYHIEFFAKNIANSEVDNTLLLANSYINGTNLSDERLHTVQALWTTNYLTDLSKKKLSVANLYGVANGDFIWAVDSNHATSRSFFGPRNGHGIGSNYHLGIDFDVATNDRVMAVCDAVITDKGFDSARGNYIILTSEVNGQVITITFMHNNSFAPDTNKGQTVSKGQVIAYAGSTGHSTGTHCHLALTVDGIPTNPFIYLYGSPKQIPAVDSSNNVTYIDVNTTPSGSWSTEVGTFWDSYYQYRNNIFIPYEP